MNELELKKLWQSANEKLEKSLAINSINSDEIPQKKVYHFISSMKPIKLFTLLTGIIWVGLGTIILSHIYFYAFSEINKFFLFSASVQVGLTAIALFIYLYQLITIYQVDITDPILKTQKKLANLKASTLWVTRILFLQLPVWTTFWWKEVMFQEWNVFQWFITGSVTLAFVFASIWLFFNIRFENRNKKWFKFIFNGKEWTPLIKAMELLEQLEEYKADIRPETNTSSAGADL
jgi:hypothetical protein